MSNLFEASEEFLKLEEYAQTIPPGSVLSWHQIHHDTQIPMTETNKQRLRGVLAKHAIEYIPIHGQGIKIADADTGVEVVSRRIIKIDNSVKRGERSNKNILSRFSHELRDDDRCVLQNTAAIFGAIRVYAKGAKVAFVTARDDRKRLVSSEDATVLPSGVSRWY